MSAPGCGCPPSLCVRRAFPSTGAPVPGTACEDGSRDADARLAFSVAGTFRIYFNRHLAAPLVWCIATDHYEIAVASVLLDAPARTVYAPKATDDHEDGKPSAWQEVTGVLVIDSAGPRITRAA